MVSFNDEINENVRKLDKFLTDELGFKSSLEISIVLEEYSNAKDQVIREKKEQRNVKEGGEYYIS